MSRMDLAPAQTTAMGDLVNSVRSLEMSRLFSPPLCTPPMPTAITSSHVGSVVAMLLPSENNPEESASPRQR